MNLRRCSFQMASHRGAIYFPLTWIESDVNWCQMQYRFYLLSQDLRLLESCCTALTNSVPFSLGINIHNSNKLTPKSLWVKKLQKLRHMYLVAHRLSFSYNEHAVLPGQAKTKKQITAYVANFWLRRQVSKLMLEIIFLKLSFKTVPLGISWIDSRCVLGSLKLKHSIYYSSSVCDIFSHIKNAVILHFSKGNSLVEGY